MPPVEIGAVDGVAVRGGAATFPALQLSNEEALRRIGGKMSDAQVKAAAAAAEKLGLRSRAWAHVPGTPLDPAAKATTLDLAVAAARGALEDAAVASDDVALILCAT